MPRAASRIAAIEIDSGSIAVAIDDELLVVLDSADTAERISRAFADAAKRIAEALKGVGR